MRAPFLERAPDLDGHDPAALAAAARAAVDGVTFGAKGDERFHLDPVPRVIAAAEWDELAAGLAQRVRALEAWCADVYGARAIVRDGVVPARVIETIDTLEPRLQGVELPLWIGVAGLDVVREPGGRFLVLEDNLRTPSGMAYTLAARETSLRLLEPAEPPRPLDDLADFMWSTLTAATGRDRRPRAAVLTDGRTNAAFWEHRRIAELLGVPLIERGRARHRRGRRRVPAHGRRPARRPRSGGCSRSRGSPAGSRSSTPSGPGSATTSSRTPTSRTWCAITSARSRCWRRCGPTTSAGARCSRRRSTGSTSSSSSRASATAARAWSSARTPSASTSSGSAPP